MSADGRTWRIVGVCLVLAVVALGAEWLAWRSRLIVGVPHLAVGCAIIGTGGIALVRVPWSRIGPLLVGAGSAWFISTLGDGTTDSGRAATALSFLYLGVLMHALCAYPTGRLPSRTDRTLVMLGYLLSLAAPLWRSDAGLIVLGIMITAGVGAVWSHRSPTERRETALAIGSGVALGVVVLTMPFVQRFGSMLAAHLGMRPWDTSTLAVSIGSLVIAFGLTSGLVRLDRRRTVVADLVIELGAGTSTGLAAELRRVLGDPSLTIGIWRAATGRFEDDMGGRVVVPAPAAPGVSIIEDRGHQVAVVLHDPALADDPGLREALIQSARLAARNAALRQELGSQADQLDASRRRLIEAADTQRRALDQRMRRGPATGLARAARQVEDLLWTGPGAVGRTDPHLAQAAHHLSLARRELDAVGRGLNPGFLDSGGIVAALQELAVRNPVPVARDLPSSLDLAAMTANTLYFTASEALANITRHAQASRAWLRVRVRDDQVELIVEDDGVGGANVDQGTGLRGLRDRLEALGGSLVVGMRVNGRGTRLVAVLPATADLAAPRVAS